MDHFVHFLLYLTYKVIIHCYFNLSRPYCKTPLPQSKRVWQRCCPAPQRDSLPGWTRRTNTLFSGHYFGTQDPREEQRLNINLQIWIPRDILELGKKICLGIPSPVSPLFFFTYFYVIHHVSHGAVPGREHPPPVEEGPAAPLEEPRHVLAGVRHEAL